MVQIKAVPERRAQNVHVNHHDHSYPARNALPAERPWPADPYDVNNVIANRRRGRTPSPEREASAAPTTVLDPSELYTPKVSLIHTYCLYTHKCNMCACVCARMHACIACVNLREHTHTLTL
jgi:hypothetical protein